jgi:putative transcriptional regulator
MWSFPKSLILNQALVLRQPEAGRLIRKVGQLIQEPFAGVLGVTYSTLNLWENSYIQPPPLVLKQASSVTDQLNSFFSKVLRDGGETLLSKYFTEKDRQ